MKFINRAAYGVVVVVLVTLGITMLSAGARAQGEGWWIVRAEYGDTSQRNDVNDNSVQRPTARGCVMSARRP